MNHKEKKEQILRWWDEGRIRKVGGCYSVPVDAFIMGIIPRMVHQVLRDKKEKEVDSE